MSFWPRKLNIHPAVPAPSRLELLPPEIQLEVLQYSSADKLAQYSQASSQLYNIARQNILWRRHLAELGITCDLLILKRLPEGTLKKAYGNARLYSDLPLNHSTLNEAEVALLAGDTEVFIRLVREGRGVAHNEYLCLCIAARQGNLAAFNFILNNKRTSEEKLAFVTGQSHTLGHIFCFAVRSGNNKLVSKILDMYPGYYFWPNDREDDKKKIMVTWDNYEPLRVAILAGNVTAIKKLFLRYGYIYHSLINRTFDSRYITLDLFKKNYPDNSHHVTYYGLLALAASTGKLAVIEAILNEYNHYRPAAEIKFEIACQQNHKVLCMAAQSGSIEAINTILKLYGRKRVTEKQQALKNALSFALRAGKVKAAQKLMAELGTAGMIELASQKPKILCDIAQTENETILEQVLNADGMAVTFEHLLFALKGSYLAGNQQLVNKFVVDLQKNGNGNPKETILQSYNFSLLRLAVQKNKLEAVKLIVKDCKALDLQVPVNVIYDAIQLQLHECFNELLKAYTPQTINAGIKNMLLNAIATSNIAMVGRVFNLVAANNMYESRPNLT